jgi:hypothetical protein
MNFFMFQIGVTAGVVVFRYLGLDISFAEWIDAVWWSSVGYFACAILGNEHG